MLALVADGDTTQQVQGKAPRTPNENGRSRSFTTEARRHKGRK